MSEYPKSRVDDLLTRRGVESKRVLRVVEVGSTAHGISTADTGDDLDLTVIRVEDFPELVYGSPNRQSMMIRTQPDGVRSRMGDIDLNVYTLRKFTALAAKGNPSILGAIFSKRVHKDAINLDGLASRIASRKAGYAFLGYMNQQLERWQGTRGQKNVKRPELIDAYGFDTKYAGHVIRLGLQGVEYMKTGQFSMPMPDEIASAIVDLRTGGLPEDEALEWANNVLADLEDAMLKTELPREPAHASINLWLVEQYAKLVGLSDE